jgi:phospholipid transport system transporter-binding protein
MLVLPAELTQREASACLAQLLSQFGTEPVVQADASALTRFDSSALAVLLACRRACLKAGRTFKVCGAPPQLQQLARLYGVTDLLIAASI